MDKTDTSAPSIKVRRTRKRLYDPLPGEDNKAVSEPSSSNLEYSATQVPGGDSSESEHLTSETSNETSPRFGDSAAQASEGTPATGSSVDKSRAVQADKIIKNYMLWSAGTALIPVPLVDLVAVTVLELKMLKKLCDHYEMEFSKQRGKSLIASLLGGVHVRAFYMSLSKTIPVLGTTAVVALQVVLSGAVTYAVGKVFVQHFETGGTLLDFNSSKAKAFFAEKYREGWNVASDMQKPKA